MNIASYPGSSPEPGYEATMIQLVLLSLDTLAVASNPGFPFRIFSPKLRDKIGNGKPGFEATLAVHLCLYGMSSIYVFHEF